MMNTHMLHFSSLRSLEFLEFFSPPTGPALRILMGSTDTHRQEAAGMDDELDTPP